MGHTDLILLIIIVLYFGTTVSLKPAPRFGECPLPRLSTDYCVKALKAGLRSSCRFDSDCKNTQLLCCSNGCAYTCVKPILDSMTTTETYADENRKIAEGTLRCPPPRYTNPKKCPTGVFRLACKVDSDCRNLGLHCCSNGCSGVCVKLVSSDIKSDSVLIQGNIAVNKTDARKPSYYEGCPAIRHTPDNCARMMFKFICKNEFDCKNPGEKCCNNGCVDVCVNTSTNNDNVGLKIPTPTISTDTSKSLLTRPYCPPPVIKSDQCPKKGTFKSMCLTDGNCKPGSYCCFNGCVDVCIKLASLDTDALQENIGPIKTDIVKIQTGGTMCPPQKYTRQDCARMRFRYVCNVDSECKPAGQKCCNNGCVGYCVDMEVKSTTATISDASKAVLINDYCPSPTLSTDDCVKIRFKSMCSTDDECNISGQKCCNNGCVGVCVNSNSYAKNFDSQKNATGQEVTKTSPVTAQCPPPIHTSEVCDTIRFHSTCVTDDDCNIVGQKCCSNGCVGVCVSPSQLKSYDVKITTATAATKSGTKISSSDQCPPPVHTQEACMTMRFRSMCVEDSDCNGQKCCSNGCVNNCVSLVPDKTIELSNASISKVDTKLQDAKNKCPAPTLTREDCARMRFKPMCQVDTDCESSDEICCNNGCVSYCFIQSTSSETATKLIENTTIANTIAVKNGFCPGSIYLPTKCSFVKFASCENDGDCILGLKCCGNGCGKSCMEPSTSCTNKNGVCPNKNVNCFWSQCKSDCECPGTQKCCYGCMCTEPEVDNKKR